jgi:hypothetical protein
VSSWKDRPQEEASLLNPAFISTGLWSAARGYLKTDVPGRPDALPFTLAFLVLPLVLHRQTRESLPPSTRTSVAVWASENPVLRARLPERTRTLVPFTRAAMLFGGTHGLLSLSGGDVVPNESWKRKVTSVLADCTDEVRLCIQRADFVGRWLATAGDPLTALSLLGVQP